MLKQYLTRIETIDHLIHIKGTGTPKDLAKRLSISERALYETLALMKEQGAPIHCCKFKQSYYYLENGRFSVRFFKNTL